VIDGDLARVGVSERSFVFADDHFHPLNRSYHFDFTHCMMGDYHKDDLSCMSREVSQDFT
jgi:hypothetical protein